MLCGDSYFFNGHWKLETSNIAMRVNRRTGNEEGVGNEINISYLRNL